MADTDPALRNKPASGTGSQAGPAFVQSGGCLIAERLPDQAIHRFQEAFAVGRPVALIDSASDPERLSDLQKALEHPEAVQSGMVWIPTGGTSGRARFCGLRSAAINCAAQAFCNVFPRVREHWSLLPPHHIGGLMPVVRAACAKGDFIWADYRNWVAGEFKRTPAASACLSLVPTQLTRLMASSAAVDFLRRFDVILVGGAALSSEARTAARRLCLALAPCYGMTETAAMVTALPPDVFAEGSEGCGFPLPHVSIEIESSSGQVAVDSEALFDGYLEHDSFFPRKCGPWPAPDTARWGENGSVCITGRLDRMINTGGRKVSAEHVEQIVGSFSGVKEAFVFGAADSEWGERVVAAVASDSSDTEAWSEAARSRLAPEERPKTWLPVGSLPRTEMGKINVSALRLLLRKSFS